MVGRLNESAPQLEGRIGRLLLVVGFGLVAGWVIVVHFTVPVLPFDDAFITYKYADNIVAGRGAVYNQGERVFGSSTPLYLLWLTTLRLGSTHLTLPDLAVRLNSIWLLLAGLATYLLVCRLTASRIVAAVGAMGLMLHRTMLVTSTGGMESFLFVSLVLLALLALTSGRPWLLGVLAGLAVLTRPEGAVLMPLAVLGFWRQWRKLAAALAGCLVLLGLWVVLAGVYYGTPVPHSVIAKSQPIYPVPPGFAVDTVTSGVARLLTDVRSSAFKEEKRLVIWGLLALLAVASIAYPPSRQRLAWTPAVFLGGLLLLYWLGNPMVFPWYWPHFFAPALVAVLVGLHALGGLIGEQARLRLPRVARVAPLLLLAFALVWCLLALVGPYLHSAAGMWASVADVSRDGERLRVLAYRQAAERLNTMASAGERLAAPEIGSLGYYFQGPVLDGCGLVTPEAIPFLPVPPTQRHNPMNAAISLEFVQATEPDWIATMPIFADRSLFPSAWFRQRYALVGSIPLPQELWLSREILLLRRVAVLDPAGAAGDRNALD